LSGLRLQVLVKGSNRNLIVTIFFQYLKTSLKMLDEILHDRDLTSGSFEK
jgi:hypothetical protein